MAAGELGEITASNDGVTWTTRTSGSDLANVVWTGSQFVAVGGHGKVLTSPDGIEWTYRTTGTSGDFLHDVAWSGTRYVAGAQSYILSSVGPVPMHDRAGSREAVGREPRLGGMFWKRPHRNVACAPVRRGVREVRPLLPGTGRRKCWSP